MCPLRLVQQALWAADLGGRQRWAVVLRRGTSCRRGRRTRMRGLAHLALIDHAVVQKKPLLNTFKPYCEHKSKLICNITGDTINKSDEHNCKHVNNSFKALAISFSTMTLFTWFTPLYVRSLQYTGPAYLVWGWVIVSLFTSFVGHGSG